MKKREAGQALILVLIMLALGTLMAVPALRLTHTTLKSASIIGDRNKNYGWGKYAEEFRLYDWEVRSLGDLENIADFVNKTKDIEVIIIDEAHRFRNQDTKDYE